MVHGSVKVTAYALAAVMAFSGMSITADAAAATTVLPSGGVDLTIAKGNTLENITTDVSGTALEIQSILMPEQVEEEEQPSEEETFRNLVIAQVNDYVKKGDLLVSNTVTSTSGVNKIIETQGVIKAYTYIDYEASIDKNKFDDGEAFSYLLYSIRCKLGIIDKIDRENVLDYGIIGNKRVLKMQYVLIEDIASKKEN